MLTNEPEALGPELCERFAGTLGTEYWRQLITNHADAWLQIAKESNGPRDDLYKGNLHEVTAATLFIHGKLDPRTEPGELDDVREQLPESEMRILNNGSHSPHSEGPTADLATSIASAFLAKVRAKVA